jgi:hypothetical protein
VSADPAMLGTSGYARRERDAYYTPSWVTRALVSKIYFQGGIWEPAAGRGDLSAVLRDAGYRVIESDIAWSQPVDFLLQQSLPGNVGSIVTNPPFDRIEAFIRHALELARPVDGMVAMLARNEFDCAVGRKDLFDRPPFAMKVVLTKRPRWSELNIASPRHNFSWFVWDWQHTDDAVLRYAP